jgi:hypothetical protein
MKKLNKNIMKEFILVPAYCYYMSNDVYDDYRPIKSCKFYDNFNVAKHELYNAENEFHADYQEHEYYVIQDDGTYYSEKFNDKIYPPKLYTVIEI